MKRLDKALEEAFEKEKQVKIETMSLMKRYGIKNDNRHASYRNYKIGRSVIPEKFFDFGTPSRLNSLICVILKLFSLDCGVKCNR
jgi:hypothetical protein